jgi:sepiapterin reductase
MEDPVIIVTGAGKGIGKSIAVELLARSRSETSFKPRLMLISRTLGDLKSLQKDLIQGGLKAEILEADIGDEASGAKITQACLKAYGRIDCLVNNAGVGRFGNFQDLKAEDLDYVFDINLKGTFLLTQTVFKEMEKQKSGHIVFVTSVAAKKPFEQSSIYCMSKFGQQGLVEVLRLYGYKSGVRITNVLPGATFTPMWGTEMPQDTVAKMMHPQAIARSIVEAIRLKAPANLDEIVIRPVTGDL